MINCDRCNEEVTYYEQISFALVKNPFTKKDEYICAKCFYEEFEKNDMGFEVAVKYLKSTTSYNIGITCIVSSNEKILAYLAHDKNCSRIYLNELSSLKPVYTNDIVYNKSLENHKTICREIIKYADILTEIIDIEGLVYCYNVLDSQGYQEEIRECEEKLLKAPCVNEKDFISYYKCISECIQLDNTFDFSLFVERCNENFKLLYDSDFDFKNDLSILEVIFKLPTFLDINTVRGILDKVSQKLSVLKDDMLHLSKIEEYINVNYKDAMINYQNCYENLTKHYNEYQSIMFEYEDNHESMKMNIAKVASKLTEYQLSKESKRSIIHDLFASFKVDQKSYQEILHDPYVFEEDINLLIIYYNDWRLNMNIDSLKVLIELLDYYVYSILDYYIEENIIEIYKSYLIESNIKTAPPSRWRNRYRGHRWYLGHISVAEEEIFIEWFSSQKNLLPQIKQPSVKYIDIITNNILSFIDVAQNGMLMMKYKLERDNNLILEPCASYDFIVSGSHDPLEIIELSLIPMKIYLDTIELMLLYDDLEKLDISPYLDNKKLRKYRDLLLNMHSTCVKLLTDNNPAAVEIHFALKKFSSHDLSREEELAQMKNETARMKLEHLKEMLKAGVDNDIEKIIQLKSRLNDIEGSDDEFITEEIINLFHQIINRMVDSKRNTKEFDEAEENVKYELDGKHIYLNNIAISGLTTAELLFKEWICDESRNNKNIDYSFVSGMYYQALENTLNHLFYWDYKTYIISKDLEQTIWECFYRNQFNTHFNGKGQKAGDYYYYKDKSGVYRLKEAQTLGTLAVLLGSAVNYSNPVHWNHQLCGLTEFLSSTYLGIKPIAVFELAKALNVLTPRRNNAAHGVKQMQKDDAIIDRNCVYTGIPVNGKEIENIRAIIKTAITYFSKK